MKKTFLLFWVLLLPWSSVHADNFGMSKTGESATITFSHTASCDSGRVWFGYQDSTNWYASYKLTPAGWDNAVLLNSSVSLDSIGTHVVRVSYWETDAGSVSGYVAGIWFHKKDVVDEFEDRGYGYGSGVFACTVYTKLFSDSSVIPNIHVIAKNTDQTQLLANGYTNANGWVVLGLNSIAGGALHKFWLMNIEYSFDFPESADINTDTSVTFYGTAFDYGDPPAENQCAVYGQLFDSRIDSLGGAVVKAKVYVPPDSVLRYDGHVISPFTVSDTTNVTGRWRLDLAPNSLFTPTGTWYIFTIEKPDPWGGIIVEEDTLTVPEDESYQY